MHWLQLRPVVTFCLLILLLIAAGCAWEEPPATATALPGTTTVATTPQPTAAPPTAEPPTPAPVPEEPAEWVFRTGGEVFSSPVLSPDGSAVYFGGTDWNVYAVDTATGDLLWTFETGDQVIASPALTDGTVYVGSTDGRFYALDASDGSVRWQTPLGVMISSPAVADGAVYTAAFTPDMQTGEMNGQVVALDAVTGVIRWQYEIPGVVISSPDVAAGVVYAGSAQGMLALDVSTGELLWQNDFGPTQSSPAYHDGRVYIGDEDGHVLALDAATGAEVWRFEDKGPFIATPRIHGDRVYTSGGLDGHILALDAATGEEIWRLATTEPTVSSPLLVDGVLYVGASNGRLYALDAADGALKWFFQTSDAIWSSPAVDDRKVYFGSFDRTFYAISREEPRLDVAALPQPTPLALQPTPLPLPDPPATASDGELPWWNDRTFYEVFVRSFQDSDGDGIGDFEGLMERLDYLNDGDPATTDDLGITGIWLMPNAQSPSYHGYDVSDYFTIEEDYGTNEDYLRFLDEAHKRGIAVVVDLVMNHTSREHPWFVEARRPGTPHETWYIWDATPDFWLNPWGGAAWHQVGLRYYFGMFWEGMPDLNYRNGEVTNAMNEVIRFWLEDMRADGFRLDAIRHLIEDGEVQSNTPETHTWLEGFHRYVHDINPNALTIGEVWDTTAAVVPYIGDEVNLAFEFQLAKAIIDSLLIRNNAPLYGAWAEVLAQYPDSQYAPFLTNHDQDRVMNQLRGDEAAAKVAAGLYLTSPGVPFIYYGEEIGMSGAKPDERIRTPMQWGVNAHGGPSFSRGEAWEPLQADWQTRTVDAQDGDPDSLLSYYRALIHLRNTHPALRTGSMTLVESSSTRVVSYLRQEDEDILLVVANLDREPISDYGLTTDAVLPIVTAAEVMFGEGTAVLPRIHSGGGFDAYMPLPVLPPRSVIVIALGR
jgi:glycosidase/outer membrane protein assembly factor BamB